jgi:hypothetical protein
VCWAARDRPIFAGLLYCKNLPIPATAAPGLDLPLVLRQLDRDSNTVFVATQ